MNAVGGDLSTGAGPALAYGRRRWPEVRRCVVAGAVVLLASVGLAEQVKERFVTVGPEGRLVYRTDPKGNRIPDFSTAGYGGGGVPLPDVPSRVVVYPAEGDDGRRIQAGIDQVAARAPDEHGFRGAVYLPAGRYEVAGQLRLTASGVVLRGAGAGEDGTVLVATGTGRRTLIEVAGQGERVLTGSARAVTVPYVPVGAHQLRVDDAAGLEVGERVVITRPTTPEWVEAVGMHIAPARTPYRWRPQDIVLTWDRTLVGKDGDELTLDAPLTTALDSRFGGGTVTPYRWDGRIRQVGIEHLRCVSEFVHPTDEEHAWMAVTLDAVEHAWVADVTAVHFASSAVQVGAGARAVTVQDCVSLAPVSEMAGYRRHSFHSSGQQTLFLRCRAERGRHDFTVGYFAAGPNVFLEVEAVESHGTSGSIGSWASGALFDNITIDGGGLSLDNLETWNGGVGWAAANSVLWQASASVMVVRRPPTADNWAVGIWGEFAGDGWWDQVDEFVQPRSLYRAQLAERIGAAGLAALAPRSPVAPAPATLQGLARVDTAPGPERVGAGRPLQLADGWLKSGTDGRLLIGGERPITWWRGSMNPARANEFNANLTRFAPGQTGPGATDDLDALTTAMTERGEVLLRHHYGLWYERRRDDHQRMRRASADVWPPFFEQPWARSGEGEAWHRLSRYDLTQFNPWYFGRLREFAELGRRKGVVLVNEMYFQHNILESGAHWVDSPWRPVNALQATDFPEPPPFTGDTVKVADWFYDVTHPGRREWHRAYIRQCLQNLAEQPNVIHTTSAEFSGPLHFMRFWVDVVLEWQRETGHHPLIALSAPKEVQDAILADPVRSAAIDVVDFTYWWRTDSELYAPPGGANLAPRQHLRLWRGGRATAASLAGMVAEYRERFPGKAVMTGLPQPDPWAFAAAGGSFPALPPTTDARLLQALPSLQPMPAARAGQWTLAGPSGWLVVALDREPVVLELGGSEVAYQVHPVDPLTGQPGAAEGRRGAGRVSLPAAATGTTVWWITR